MVWEAKYIQMALRTVGERPRHNPRQLCCRFASCHRWFRNQSGLTKHIRSCHSGQAPSRRQCSPPANALPIHRDDESSSRGNRDSAPPSTPLAGSQFSDNDLGSSTGIRQPHQDGSFSPAHTFHGSPRESSPEVVTPEGDEPISKVFHPVINGSYMS